MRRYQLFFVLFAALAGMALLGCTGQTGSQPANAAAADELSLQTAWFHEYSSAWWFAAEKGGHFAEENLHMQLQEGGFGENGYIDPIERVLIGEVNFGMSDSLSVILARSEGKPIVAIGASLQRAPFALISLSEQGIVRPQDLVGRSVMVNDGGAMQQLQALLAIQDIDPAEVEIMSRTSFGVDPLIDGSVDVLGGWIINEGVLVEESGYEASYILLSDYGVESYTSILVTTEDMITNQPEVVERVLRAFVGGLQDVLDSPEQAVEYVLTYNEELDEAEQMRRLQATIPLINVPGVELGMMQAEVWEATHQVLLDQGGLEEPIDLEAAYTNTFLEKIYAE
jgi:NitT/TauT family transport system substrate-binding protein